MSRKKNKNIASNASLNLSISPCIICLDEVRCRGKITVCDHWFCFSCIMEWSKVKTRAHMGSKFRSIKIMISLVFSSEHQYLSNLQGKISHDIKGKQHEMLILYLILFIQKYLNMNKATSRLLCLHRKSTYFHSRVHLAVLSKSLFAARAVDMRVALLCMQKYKRRSCSSNAHKCQRMRQPLLCLSVNSFYEKGKIMQIRQFFQRRQNNFSDIKNCISVDYKFLYCFFF